MSFLDDVVFLEDKFFSEGVNDGRTVGTLAGYHDGKELGLHTGWALGMELGAYRGCLRSWLALNRSQSLELPERVLAKLRQLLDLIGSYPAEDPQNEDQHELLDNIRIKFKMMLSQLGLVRNFPSQLQGGSQRFDLEGLPGGGPTVEAAAPPETVDIVAPVRRVRGGIGSSKVGGALPPLPNGDDW